MANRRIKNYFGLEEAICDIISQDNENGVTYDVVMLSPDLDVLTDEEEGGDYELYENKLSRDVRGSIEMVTFRPTENVFPFSGFFHPKVRRCCPIKKKKVNVIMPYVFRATTKLDRLDGPVYRNVPNCCNR